MTSTLSFSFAISPHNSDFVAFDLSNPTSLLLFQTLSTAVALAEDNPFSALSSFHRITFFALSRPLPGEKASELLSESEHPTTTLTIRAAIEPKIENLRPDFEAGGFLTIGRVAIEDGIPRLSSISHPILMPFFLKLLRPGSLEEVETVAAGLMYIIANSIAALRTPAAIH